MGILKFYYDNIIYTKFINAEEDTRDYLLREWDPKDNDLTEHIFYKEISEEITKQFRIVYTSELSYQIWKVISSMRRILLSNVEISEQFEKLLEINKTLPAQRTPEWHKFREDKLSASIWGTILNYIGSQNELLLQRLGYEPAQFKGNEFTVWGTMFEPVATSIYEKRENKVIIEFGCLGHPDHKFLAASPDGIADDGIMLEIKCPPKREIIPIPTNYYWAQMQGQLEVCDLERCDFLECKFLEYDEEEEYLSDIDEENNCTFSNNMESGVILTFTDNQNNKQYFYSEFFLRGDALQDWIIDHINKYSNTGKIKDRWRFNGARYWYLKIYQCQPVFRDRKWFAESLEKLKMFYDLMNYYKSLGEQGIKSLLSERRIKGRKSDKKDSSLPTYTGFSIKDGDQEQTVVIESLKKFGFKKTDIPPDDDEEEEPKKPIEEQQIKKFGFKMA